MSHAFGFICFWCYRIFDATLKWRPPSLIVCYLSLCRTIRRTIEYCQHRSPTRQIGFSHFRQSRGAENANFFFALVRKLRVLSRLNVPTGCGSGYKLSSSCLCNLSLSKTAAGSFAVLFDFRVRREVSVVVLRNFQNPFQPSDPLGDFANDRYFCLRPLRLYDLPMF